MKLIAKLNFKKFNKIFLLYVNFPAKKTANKKPIKYPIVGPVKYIKPTPFSGVPEKTGKPKIPSKRYKVTVAIPNFHPKLTQ